MATHGFLLKICRKIRKRMKQSFLSFKKLDPGETVAFKPAEVRGPDREKLQEVAIRPKLQETRPVGRPTKPEALRRAELQAKEATAAAVVLTSFTAPPRIVPCGRAARACCPSCGRRASRAQCPSYRQSTSPKKLPGPVQARKGYYWKVGL